MSDSESCNNKKKDDNLDSLLDDALEDFSKPLLKDKKCTTTKSLPGTVGSLPTDGVLTEDVIKKATANFEASMRAIMLQQQKVTDAQSQSGGVDGQQIPEAVDNFDISTLAAEIEKFGEAATNVVTSGGNNSSANIEEQDGLPDFQKFLAETMKSVNANSQEFQEAAPSAEDVSKLLGGLPTGGGGEEGEGGLFPLMQSMLENILSKEIMYPPIKEIVGKYPDWLSQNKDTVEASEFERYTRQFDTMKQVVNLFDSERESNSDEIKSKRFESLVDLMQKLQSEGHPPTELAGDTTQNFMNFDPSATGSLPDMGKLLGGASGASPGGEEQCSVM